VGAWTSLAGIDNVDRCRLFHAGNLVETVSWQGLLPPGPGLSSEAVSYPREQAMVFLDQAFVLQCSGSTS